MSRNWCSSSVAAVNIGEDLSRVARDEWGRELASGRCLSLSQDSVRFLADWSVARPCERNGVLLGLVVPSFCVQFKVLYFSRFLFLVGSVRGYLVVVDGRKEH